MPNIWRNKNPEALIRNCLSTDGVEEERKLRLIDLFEGPKQHIPENTTVTEILYICAYSSQHMCVCVGWDADLGKDVLLPHEFLPLPVGCGGDHRQNILTVVWNHTHKENQVLQKFSHKPGGKLGHEVIKCIQHR